MQISGGVTSIYANDPGVEECLSGSLFAAIGIPRSLVDIPSITDERNFYFHPTFIDQLFVHFLYHPNFPTNRNQESVEKFLETNSSSIWHTLLQEDMSISLKN